MSRTKSSFAVALSLSLGALVATSACGSREGHEASSTPGTGGTEDSAMAPEAHTLDGKPLYRAEPAADARAKLEANLAEAQARFDDTPDDPENVIWLGRRLAYLGRYRDAVDVYSRGIEAHPDSFKLYRHRGHRYITLRRFDDAIADLEKASTLIRGVPDEIEPDGAPNPAGVPRSTSHFNIWYHLGLAYYLKGDFDNAARAYEACMEFSKANDDSLVATSDWLYMIYRRLGRAEDAARVLEPIRETMEILENDSYHKRLLMYKGSLSPEALLDTEQATDLDLATQGYGVGNWYYYNGDHARAREIFERVVSGSAWAAFGFIAAEADLKRMAATTAAAASAS
jgi:tetratricopeptide (TPR) repeat protein